MADYPSVDYAAPSQINIMDGRLVERTDGGTLRARSMWGGVKRTWTLQHVVNDTDRDAILAHYAAHLDVSFTFTDHESSAHTVLYGPNAIYREDVADDLTRLSVTLMEV